MNMRKFLSKNSEAIQAGCSLLSTVILGICSVLISFQSLKIAEYGNEIAKTANLIAEVSNLPVISCSSIYNEDDRMLDVTFYNSGGAIKDVQVEIHSFFEFRTIDQEGAAKTSYIVIENIPLTAELSMDGSSKILQIRVPSINYPSVSKMIHDAYLELCLEQIAADAWSPDFRQLLVLEYKDIFDSQHTMYYRNNGFAVIESTDEEFNYRKNTCTGMGGEYALYGIYQGDSYGEDVPINFITATGTELCLRIKGILQEDNLIYSN